jgi:hypothetical protein
VAIALLAVVLDLVWKQQRARPPVTHLLAPLPLTTFREEMRA